METGGNVINRCLGSPILIYESTSRDVPINLKLLLSTFDEHELTQSDHLVILAYTMMVESGFLPTHTTCGFEDMKRSPTFNINFLRAAQTMPSNCKNVNGVYTIKFTLVSLPNNILCLTAQPTGSFVVFTAWLKDNEDMPSWCVALDCDKYVMRSQTEFMNHKYFNLKELSRQFKNGIPLPARSFLKEYGNVDDSCLIDLPLEMKLAIFSYLDKRCDIINLSKTCVDLHDVYHSKMLPGRLHFPARMASCWGNKCKSSY